MKISIFKFLSDYYGINLDASADITHKLAKKKFKVLKGCPFKYALHNPELIKNGIIIYVKDTHNEVLPYICPNKIISSVSICSYTEETEKDDSLSDKHLLEELSTLPSYIVHKLLSKYKEEPSFYKIIKKELISRGVYENKKYKLRKEIDEIKLEEGEFDDKYQRRRKIKCKKS